MAPLLELRRGVRKTMVQNATPNDEACYTRPVERWKTARGALELGEGGSGAGCKGVPVQVVEVIAPGCSSPLGSSLGPRGRIDRSNCIGASLKK